MPGDAHKSCPNARFITCNQATMNSAEITYVIFKLAAAFYLSFLCACVNPRPFGGYWPPLEFSICLKPIRIIILLRILLLGANLIANFMIETVSD